MRVAAQEFLVQANRSFVIAAAVRIAGEQKLPLGYNISSTNGCFSQPRLGDMTISVAQVSTEVVDAALKDNGGPTKTHALIERGLAVDAGYCPGETTDQRGLARPYDDTRLSNAAAACDIGAFEWQPAPAKRSK